MRTIDFVITDENAGKRIKEFLRAFGVSGSLLKKLKNTRRKIALRYPCPKSAGKKVGHTDSNMWYESNIK